MLGTRGITQRYSGIEVSLCELSNRLASKGYEILVYCRKNKQDPKEKDLKQNLKLIFIPTVNSKHFGTIIHVFLSILHLLKTNVDIVHFHALGPSFLSFIPRIFGKKVIVTIQGLDWKRKKWNPLASMFLRLCEYSAMFFSNQIIVVSKTLKVYFENKFNKNVSYVPNAISPPSNFFKISSSNLENRYILFAGRLVPEKCIHTLINAHKELNSDIKLKIAGEPSFTDKYVHYLKTIANNKVDFLGSVDGKSIEELYQNAYLFVLPSEVEGLSVSLLEAMCYRTCVLVSDITENLEVIGHCGVTFKTNDYHDLKNKLQNLINNPKLVTEIGNKGQKRVLENYNWDNIITDIEKIYSSIGCNR